MFRLPVDAQRAVAVGVGRDLDILLAVDDVDDPGAFFRWTQLGCPNVLVELRLVEEVGSWIGNAGFEIQLPVVRGLRTPSRPEAFVRLEDDLVRLFLDRRGIVGRPELAGFRPLVAHTFSSVPADLSCVG
ncbi:PapG chaperone-binding domain-containing protein [Halohasta litorea]|uniref:PapG chaperone-binding domain-containing protein n=1 Tax=Halohasta litorea TaxID=869891 RepID=A0ABD6D8J4_9EURY